MHRLVTNHSSHPLPFFLAVPLPAGNSPNIRKFSKKASRVVYELFDCPTASNAPATIRYMFNYKMADFSPANCKKAVELQGKITSALGET